MNLKWMGLALPGLLGLAALLMAAGSATPNQRAASGLPEINIRTGDPFPALRLPSLKDGKPVSMTDFRGKKVILHIFASW